MMDEHELRELHRRLVGVLGYAKACGISMRAVRELIVVKVHLEFVLEMPTASAREWAAATFKAINNLEDLKRTSERSRNN